MTSSQPTAPSSDADCAEAAQGEEAFAARMYSALAAKSTPNLAFSPTSIRMALAMAWAGARGDTAREMANTLVFQADPASVHRGFAGMLRDLARGEQVDAPPAANVWQQQQAERRMQTVRVVNRLWGQTGRAFRSDYQSLLAEDYAAPLVPLDFAHDPEAARAAINRFVAQATEQKIEDLVPEGMLQQDTKLVLTNSVYFKAQWDAPFPTYATADGDFHVSASKTVRAPLMQLVTSTRYAQTGGLQLVELPYASRKLSMIIALPVSGDLSAVERGMGDATLQSWMGALGSGNARVHVVLPRFKATGSLSLASTLEAMGIRSAFHYGPADFSGIDGTRDLYLSEAVHQAYVAVDESGTEAAAATALGAVAGAAPADPPVEFRADRPFVFVIRDTTSGAVLFMGRVNDPTA